MRVISGTHKSREIKAPKGIETRPTSDRVKEAIFNTISKKVQDAIVLDLFAGSGNLSFEAISRGAEIAYLVEKDKNAYATIMENVKKLEMDHKVKVLNLDAEKSLQFFSRERKKFDLIFLDPPYYGKYYCNVLSLIFLMDLLNDNGVIIVEAPKNMEKEDFLSIKYEIVKEARYGDTKIFYFQKSEG